MAGFGRSKFGLGPFGRSDTGNDLIVERFPDEYLGEGLDPRIDIRNNNYDPLLKVLKTYANSVKNRRLTIDTMPQLLDNEVMPLEIVRLWGDMLGLGIDKNDPDFLQRTFLGTASQWLQIKASTKGYEVRGLASGFTVRVDNFWRVIPAYAPHIPPRFQYFIKPKEADARAIPILHTDQPPGTFPLTPTSEDDTYAKSSYVRVVFQVPFYKEGVDYNKLLSLVIDKIRDVVGIHHEYIESQFLIEMKLQVTPIVTMRIDEVIAPYYFNEMNLYDVIPADVVPCDGGITVDVELLGDTAIAVVVGAVISLLARETTNFDNLQIAQIATTMAQEVAKLESSVTNTFDNIPADAIPADSGPITAVLTTPP